MPDDGLPRFIPDSPGFNEQLQRPAPADRSAQGPDEVAALLERLKRFEERWGLNHEQMARDLLPDMLRRKGWDVHKAKLLEFEDTPHVLVAAHAGGRLFTLAAEVRGRVWQRAPLQPVAARARHPAFAKAVRQEGFPEPIVPAVFGLLLYAGADQLARQAGVGLFSPDGEVVSPPLEG